MTLHITEDEVNYLSTITYTNREHNVTDTPSHLYNMRSGVSITMPGGGGGLRLSFVSSKGVKFMTLEKQCKGEMRSG